MFRKSDQPASPSPTEPSPGFGSRRPEIRRRLWGVVAIVCFLLAGYQLYDRWLAPAPPVVRPGPDVTLEPFVQVYVDQQVAWAEGAPRRWDRHATLGLIYAANGIWEAARQSFVNAVTLNDDEPLAALYAAVALEFSGDRAGAITEYQAVAERFPQFVPALSRLAEAQLRQDNLPAAGAAFEKLIAVSPEEWRGYAGLAEVKLREEAASEALPLARQAVELAPAAGPAHHLLGLILQQLGQEDEANRELQLGLSPIRPPLPDEWSRQVPMHMRRAQDLVALGQDLLRNGRPDQAVSLLSAAIQYDTNSIDLLTVLGLAQQQAGRAEESAASLEQALRLDTNHVPAIVGLANTRLMQGNPAAARALAERAVAEAPDLPQPYLLTANVALAEEQNDAAVAALEKAATLAPASGQIHLDIGNILLLNEGRFEPALSHYQEAIKREPYLIPAYVRIAQIHARQGRTNDAVEAIRAALEYAPGDTNLLAFEAALLSPPTPETAAPPNDASGASQP